MDKLYEFEVASFLDVRVSSEDVEVISDSLIKAAKNKNRVEVLSYLENHWDNLMSCLKLTATDDKFFSYSRDDIFKGAKKQNGVFINENSNSFLITWRDGLLNQIGVGKLTHFKKFGTWKIEHGSLFLKGIKSKYKINRRSIDRYFKRAYRQLHYLNNKVKGLLHDFVEWSFDRSRNKPWLNPLFYGVIVLMVLFTVTISNSFFIAIGVLEQIFVAVKYICKLCAVYYVSTWALRDTGLISID